MNPEFEIGDIMIITDHINLFPEHPLRGKNYEEWGPRFPDMSEAYSQRLIAHAKDIAKEKASVSCTGICRHTGPDIRDTGRIPLLPHHRRRRRWHVDSA